MTDEVQLLKRDDVDDLLGTLARRLDQVEHELFISGNDCKLLESESATVERLLQAGKHVRVLCVSPFDVGATTLPKIDPRFSDVAQFRASMASVARLFADMQRRFPNVFEVRYLPFAPPVGIFLRDPGTVGELLKVEIYTVKPWSVTRSRPHFAVPANSAWREFWLQQVENLWALGTSAPQDAVSRFAVLIHSGSDNIDESIVAGLLETGMLPKAIALCASSDSMTKLRFPR